jgi:thiol-disulfide isomerase/thioredoxin
MKTTIILFSISFLLTAAFTRVKPADHGLKVGTYAPDFTLKDVNGHDVTLSNYKGRLVLIDFWASWCKQCRMEMPRLKKAYEKYHSAHFDGGNNFDIICIALDDDDEEWKNAIATDGSSRWTNLTEGKKWDAEIAKTYQVVSLPSNYLVDGTGKIIEKNLRGPMLEDILNSTKR